MTVDVSGTPHEDSDGDFTIGLGDTAGVDALRIEDSSGQLVATINSNGEIEQQHTGGWIARLGSADGTDSFQILSSTGQVLWDIDSDGVMRQPFNGQYRIRLGDAAGSNEFRILDSAELTVASIDSDGNALFEGVLDVEGGISANTGILTSTATTHFMGAADRGRIVEKDLAGANNFQIPPNLFTIGTSVTVVQYGAGTTSLIGGTGVTINGVLAPTMAMTGDQYAMISGYMRAANEWVFAGAFA